MKKEIIKTDITKAVNISNNEVFVSSDFIAEVFGKRHRDILKKIRDEIDYLSTENLVVRSYFQDANYINSRGKEYTRFNLTRKGFDAIVLSMTGNRAKKYKYWFIDEFHKKASILAKQKELVAVNKSSDMWQEIRGETKKAREALTDAIQTFELPQRKLEGKVFDKFVSQRIQNYTKLIYKSLGIKMELGISLRDTLKPRELFELESLEYKVADMIKMFTEEKKCDYKQTYQLIKKELL